MLSTIKLAGLDAKARSVLKKGFFDFSIFGLVVFSEMSGSAWPWNASILIAWQHTPITQWNRGLASLLHEAAVLLLLVVTCGYEYEYACTRSIKTDKYHVSV